MDFGLAIWRKHDPVGYAENKSLNTTIVVQYIGKSRTIFFSLLHQKTFASLLLSPAAFPLDRPNPPGHRVLWGQ